MKNRLIILLLAITIATSGAGVRGSTNNPHYYNYGNIATKAISGIAHGLRAEKYTSTNASTIKNYSIAAMIASAAAIASSALSQYQTESFHLEPTKDLAEAIMAFRMYQNADSIASKNKTLSPAQLKKVNTWTTAMIAALAINRPLEIGEEHFKAKKKIIGFRIPGSTPNRILNIAQEAAFPIAELALCKTMYNSDKKQD